MKLQPRLFRAAATLFALLAAISVFFSGGGPVSAGDIDKFVTAENYPDHDAVVLLNKCTHTFQVYLELHTATKYGIATRTEIERERRIKLLRDGAFGKYGNFESPTYNMKSHEYKVEASVISPEGKKRGVGKENIKKIDLTDRYSRYRIAFPGLEAGSIIEIKETVKSDYPILSGAWDFAEEVPTLRSQLVFRVPKGTNAMFNFMPKAAMKNPDPIQDGKYDVYNVTLENVPPYIDEMYMLPDNIGNPTIYYHVWMISNNDLAAALGVDPGMLGGEPYSMNWKDVAEMLGYYFDPETWEDDEESSGYRAIIENDMTRFRSGFDITEEKFNELLSWFRSEFEAVDDDLFYFSMNPEESFKLRKGGPFELAYVLRYILDQIGVNTNVILVRDADKGLVNRNMPSFAAFTHPLLKVDMMGKELWLDPFSHFCRVDQIPWQCRGIEAMRLLPDGTGKFTLISLTGAEDNCFGNMDETVLDAEGNLAGTTEITISGQHLLDLRRDIDEDDPDKFDEALKKKLKEVYPDIFNEESLEIVENGKDELRAKFSYLIPSFADVAGGYMNIDFSNWHSTSVERVFRTDTRTCDIQFPFLEMDRSSVRIVLPAGAVVEEIPAVEEMSGDYFSYSRNVRVDGNVVTFERVFKVLSPTIEAKNYLVAREFVNRVHDLDGEELIVKK